MSSETLPYHEHSEYRSDRGDIRGAVLHAGDAALNGGYMTIYDALAAKLGRAPTNQELRAEIDRIKESALVDLASKGKLSFQRKRKVIGPHQT